MQPHPDPDPTHAVIVASVERALATFLNSPDFLDTVRRGIRDGIWHKNTADTPTAASAD